MTDRGNVTHHGNDGSFLRRNWELAQAWADKHTIWEHLEP